MRLSNLSLLLNAGCAVSLVPLLGHSKTPGSGDPGKQDGDYYGGKGPTITAF